jgi:hypothetical protein
LPGKRNSSLAEFFISVKDGRVYTEVDRDEARRVA